VVMVVCGFVVCGLWFVVCGLWLWVVGCRLWTLYGAVAVLLSVAGCGSGYGL
jgi:hypothetical protein